MVIFFFQAEDGIRDLVRSRGLGDVYKRQHQDDDGDRDPAARAGGEAGAHRHRGEIPPRCTEPVSYTHLTLPTIYSV